MRKVIPVPLDAIHPGDLSSSEDFNPQLKRSLRFADSGLESQFQQYIRRTDLPLTACFPSLKERLLVFGLTVMLAALLAVAGCAVSYFRKEQTGKVLAVQCGGLLVLICATMVLLGLVYLLYARIRVSLMTTLLVVLFPVVAFSLLDSAVASALLTEGDLPHTTVTSFVPIAMVFVAASQLLVCDYLLHIVVCSGAAVIHAAIKLATLAHNPFSPILESAALGLIALLLTRRMYQIEHALRLNWVSEIQVQSAFPVSPKKASLSSVGHSSISLTTDWEEILERMTGASQVLMEACGVVVHHDLRHKLKAVGRDLNTIAAKLAAEGPNLFHIKMEQLNQDIDEEDKAFVQQNFMTARMSDVNFKSTTQHLVEQQTVSPTMFTEYQLSELLSVLNQMGKNWNFDMFFVHEVTEGKSLSVAGRFCLSKFNLASKFSISEQVAIKYFQALENGYKQNPYHNSCHGADVLNSTLFLYQNSEVITFMIELEILGSVVACLGHDVGHSALNNRFLVNSRNELAVFYNDTSVLENMHASTTYSLMLPADQNLLQTLDNDQWTIVRKVVLKMILATDMSRHFELLGNFKSTHITSTTSALCKPDERLGVFEVAIKCADIGHAAKAVELHEKWTLLVCEEFFQQGDTEKKMGLPVSMYCDRETTDIAKVTPTQSQMGFIQNIVLPLFESLNVFLSSPAIESFCIQQLRENMAHWEKKTERKRHYTVKSLVKGAAVPNEFSKLSAKIHHPKRM